MPTAAPQQPPVPTTPAGSAGPAPEQVVAAAEQEGMATREAIGSGAPQPKKAFSVKSIKAVDDQFIKTVQALAGDVELPSEAVWEPPAGMGSKWEQPLPAEVFSRLVMFAQVMGQVAPLGKKYTYEVGGLVDDTALRAVQAKLKMAAKDKKLAQALRGPGPQAGGADAEALPKPGPGGAPATGSAMSKEDEELMGAM